MPSQRRARPINWLLIFSVGLTALVALFLWLPTVSLYGSALWNVGMHHPDQLIAALPFRPYERSLLVNTLALAAVTGLLTVLVGLPVAITLARGPRLLRGPIALLTALPLTLPPILVATAWLELTRTPPARSLASLAADKPMPVGPVHVAALVLALSSFPIVAFAVAAALHAIPAELEDGARLFTGNFGVWRRITGPLLAPALWGAAGIVAALSMWEMGAPDLLDARTYTVQIYRNLDAPDNLDPQGKAFKAALAGLPLLALGCLVLWPTVRALRFYEEKMPRNAGRQDDASAQSNGSRASWWCIPLAAAVLAASPLAPIEVFLHQLHPPSLIYEEWNTNAVEIGNTVQLATLSTLGILAIAFLLVAAWRYWPARWQRWAVYATVGPLLIAPLLLGVSLINFWDQPYFSFVYGGMAPTGYVAQDWLIDYAARFAMMLIGYTARFLPLAILLLYEAARRVHDEQLESAANLGATPLQAVRTVLAPLLVPALLGLAALVWSLCAGELSTSVLINQPGGQTLPVPIFNAMHVGEVEKVAALSLILIALTVGFVLAMLGLLRSGRALRAWRRV